MRRGAATRPKQRQSTPTAASPRRPAFSVTFLSILFVVTRQSFSHTYPLLVKYSPELAERNKTH